MLFNSINELLIKQQPKHNLHISEIVINTK